MQSTRAEKIVSLALLVACFVWYVTPIGGDWLYPLTRTGGQQLTYAFLILLVAAMLSALYLRRAERIGYVGRLLLPPLAMLFAGGICVFATNAIAPYGMERLANSASEFGWMSQVRNILAFGILSGAWLFGCVFAAAMASIKFFGKVSPTASV